MRREGKEEANREGTEGSIKGGNKKTYEEGYTGNIIFRRRAQV